VMQISMRLHSIELPERTNSGSPDLTMSMPRLFSCGRLSETEQSPSFSRRTLKVGEFGMGHWIQARKGMSVVQLQIALLILGVIVAAAWLTYYASSLPR
jgi:hypothetical protein